MRQSLLVAGILCLLAAAGGCDTEQPLQVTEQTLEIEFTAQNMSVYVYNVWEEAPDLDGNSEPDSDPEVRCRKHYVSGAPMTFPADTVPWGYSLQITLIPAGSTDKEILTTEDAAVSVFNYTPFDEFMFSQQSLPPCANDPTKYCVSLGRMTGANETVWNSSYNVDFNNMCPGDPGLPAPRMNGTETEPGIPPFQVTVSRGDTIIVEARKALQAPAGLESLNVQPNLVGEIRLDGRTITPAGTTSSSKDMGDGVSFSFTVR